MGAGAFLGRWSDGGGLESVGVWLLSLRWVEKGEKLGARRVVADLGCERVGWRKGGAARGYMTVLLCRRSASVDV